MSGGADGMVLPVSCIQKVRFQGVPGDIVIFWKEYIWEASGLSKDLGTSLEQVFRVVSLCQQCPKFRKLRVLGIEVPWPSLQGEMATAWPNERVCFTGAENQLFDKYEPFCSHLVFSSTGP